MKRSPLPALLLLAGVAWTAGQAVLPDMGLEWADRLEAVAAARSREALSAACLVVAGSALVGSAVVAGRVQLVGRGARLVRTGTVLLGLGGIWLAAGRAVFNLHMYQLTDPSVDRAAALGVAMADVGAGFVPLVLTLPALLLGPVLLAAGSLRAGAGRLAWAGLACWVLGIGTFLANEFSVKATETAGIALAAVGLTLLGAALVRGATAVPGGRGQVAGGDRGAAGRTATAA